VTMLKVPYEIRLNGVIGLLEGCMKSEVDPVGGSWPRGRSNSAESTWFKSIYYGGISFGST